MTASDVRWTGWLLVGGAVAFMIGAVMWRIVYQAAEAQSLPAIAGDFAFTLYFFGAVLGVAWLAFRLTAHDWAAAEMARTGTVPAWFPALHLWSGSLYAIHLALLRL